MARERELVVVLRGVDAHRMRLEHALPEMRDLARRAVAVAARRRDPRGGRGSRAEHGRDPGALRLEGERAAERTEADYAERVGSHAEEAIRAGPGTLARGEHAAPVRRRGLETNREPKQWAPGLWHDREWLVEVPEVDELRRGHRRARSVPGHHAPPPRLRPDKLKQEAQVARGL